MQRAVVVSLTYTTSTTTTYASIAENVLNYPPKKNKPTPAVQEQKLNDVHYLRITYVNWEQ